MVYRIFVEKKEELANEAHELLADARTLLGIDKLEKVRILNRYDAEGIKEEEFRYAVRTVFSEPQTDIASEVPDLAGANVFAVEYLPGQFDQRADSAAQCIQIIYRGERPLVRSARVYVLYGDLSSEEISAIKKYVINPVEAREAALEKPETLAVEYEKPETVAVLDGFTGKNRSELEQMIKDLGLAMDSDDIIFCRDYFLSEHRDPTITELRMIDTYWSDHCRHTTFTTAIDNVSFEDTRLEEAYRHYLAVREELGVKKPVCLMDIATVSVKYLKKAGLLDKLDESEEINACTVKIDVDVDGKTEPWLLLFKNETHNHPTEIEPFGGAATCIGGAIRDPLSGRSYVYGAMRVTGAADPVKPISETIPGKLPQRKLVTGAAAGYSSYGNQIGLATGSVDEIYHPGYAAKRMEIGAVIAAAPAENVRRERPEPGDVVILLGGSTGRDGIGGATGSSKAHNTDSVKTCGAEVQKGNAPEERKLQRLFRNPRASRLIKRCNDFGAGGVSVAIGELADGLEIDLNAVPKKYEGLDGTELAISESQERMAVVVAPGDVAGFLELAAAENLQAVRVAEVREEPRLVMNWNGRRIVDISREFLNSNGATKHITIETGKAAAADDTVAALSGSPKSLGFKDKYEKLVSDLNSCSMRGLAERFDSTIGAGTVIMPFGGVRQLTPSQAMVQKIPVEKKHTDTCSVMSWGYNPFITEKDCFRGSYLAVVESVSKLIAAGAEFSDVYLTFQEYFAKPGRDPKRWGQPLSALLGAFEAQLSLGIGAIGGKDSMSGSFEKLDVPPTLVSFAVTTAKTGDIISGDFKKAGSRVVRIAPAYDEKGLPVTASLKACFETVRTLVKTGKALSCYTPGIGGVAEAVFRMAIGNGKGFEFSASVKEDELFRYDYGAFVVELSDGTGEEDVRKILSGCAGNDGASVELLGSTTADEKLIFAGTAIDINELLALYENRLESVYSCNIPAAGHPIETFSSKNAAEHITAAPAFKCAKPKVLIPAFPGTNCEYDSAKVAADAGCDPEIIVIRNLTGDAISSSIEEFAGKLGTAQIVFIPGGFSGGDEPDGSGKFITAFFRNEAVKDAVTKLLDERDGLMCGICNGFQALIKLGLVPYGRIIDTDENCPTLSFNTIARHQSRIVRTRIASNSSPWLAYTNVGDIYNVPISHGEGRFLADEALIKELAAKGQIATQYVDLEGAATEDVHFNPNGSMYAIEGITSPDGRVFGKMGHSERIGRDLYRNVPGSYDIRMFEAAVKYYK